MTLGLFQTIRRESKQGGKTRYSHPDIEKYLYLALTLEKGSGPPLTVLKSVKGVGVCVCVCVFE